MTTRESKTKRRRAEAIRERVYDGADMLVDFATLGEYGFEPVEAPCRVEPCSPGRQHAPAGAGEPTTALQRRAERLARFAA